MTFTVGRIPLQSWAVLLCAGGAGTGLYTLWDTWHSRRGAVPLFDPSMVTKSEVFRRYPAQALEGFDVVVKNYYVPADRAPPTASASCLSHSSPGASGRGGAHLAHGGARDWTQFWKDSFSIFSNEYTLGQRQGRASASASSSAISGASQDILSTRIVVGDAYAPPGTSTAEEATAATVSTTKTSASSAPPVLASATWPAGTVKYSAMVLEPHQETPVESGQSSIGAALDPNRGFLRQLADGATHQSLVRCNPLSPNVRMNCDGDPSFLGAPYLRVMLSAFLLLPSHVPSLHVAVLGVGGGSLPNFLQHYFSRVIAKLDLVDIEPMCFRAAVEDMGMKEVLNSRSTHDDIVKMYAQDAYAYLTHQLTKVPHDVKATSSSTYIAADALPSAATAGDATSAALAAEKDRPLDLLFVDVFVGSEQPEGVTSRAFLDLCHGTLSSYGVAAFNLPERNPLFVSACRGVFGAANVFTIPVPASSNTVVLARKAGGPLFSTGAPLMSPRHFWRRAQQLTDTYQLPYDLANHYPAWWRFW